MNLYKMQVYIIKIPRWGFFETCDRRQEYMIAYINVLSNHGIGNVNNFVDRIGNVSRVPPLKKSPNGDFFRSLLVFPS